MSAVTIIVADEGLGGVVTFGKAIRELGQAPILLTGPAPDTKMREWQSIYDTIQILENPYDVNQIVAAARSAAQGRPLAGLFSCYDGLIAPTTRAAAQLGLPHTRIQAVDRARNKYNMRRATQRAGIPTPRFYLIAAYEDCQKAAAEVGFPAIIKPLNGMASHLVRRVNSAAELEHTYHDLTQRIERNFAGNYGQALLTTEDATARSLDPRTAFLVEQLLEGEEYSAEVIVRDGTVHRIALFHKFLIDYAGFLECGFTRPALGPAPEREELVWQHMEQCIAALGVDNAVAHIEVMDTRDGPLLIEVNIGRPGGQILVIAVQKAVGVDLGAEVLALQTGRPRPQPTDPTITGRVTTLTIFPPQSGLLERLDGLDAVAELPGVELVIPFCKPGDRIDVQDKEFFAVNLLVSGIDDRDELVALYQRATELTHFVIDPLLTVPAVPIDE
jgi:biotin carboxylase